MKNILESLDEAVFTPELKQVIQDLYENSITSIKEEYETKLLESEAKVESVSKTLTEEFESKLVKETTFLKEGAVAYADYVKSELTVKADAFAEVLKEEYSAKATAYGEFVESNYKGKFIETMDLYLDKAVEEYLDENRLVMDESIKSAQLKAMLEGFDSLLSTGAVQIMELTESKEEVKSNELDAMKDQINKLLKENTKLKEGNTKLLKESILKETTDDMTLIQKDKFEKLATAITFNESDVEKYTKALSSIKESVISSNVIKLDESLDDSKTKAEPTWSRFL